MMRALRHVAPVMLGILAAMGMAGASLAQAPAPVSTEPRWVQYELIAFRPVDPAPSDEAWPVEQLPDYPPQIVFLLEPGSPAHAAALRAREFERSLQAEAGEVAGASGPLEAELPRLRLAGADTALASAAERIGSAPGYRLLGHYAWRQPLPAPGQPEHLLITGGEASGDHFELEGYISLSRSRFLHVETTLWLNELLPQGAPPPEDAVLLPPVPKPQLPEPDPPPLDSGLMLDVAASIAPALEGVPASDEAEPVMVEPQRAVSSIVLRTTRRLTENAVHYIDHPRLGLILSARPWDPTASTDPAADTSTATPSAVPAVPPAATRP